MNPLVVIQILTALAALTEQMTPMVLELRTAIQNNDQSSMDKLLAKLQAANDALGTAA